MLFFTLRTVSLFIKLFYVSCHNSNLKKLVILPTCTFIITIALCADLDLLCSPSQGPCCSSETCKFVPEWKKMVCKSESDCSLSSTCNGRSPECPTPQPMPNKTRCNNGTQLCINGDCSGSICLEWNLTECFLTSSIIPNIDKRKLCELACQNGTDPASCRSTSEFAHAVGLPTGGISLRPGSPCDNFQVNLSQNNLLHFYNVTAFLVCINFIFFNTGCLFLFHVYNEAIKTPSGAL